MILVLNFYVGIWFLQQLKYILDSGHDLPLPDGLIINGRGWNGYTFTVDQGKLLTCLLKRILFFCNVPCLLNISKLNV